MRALAAATEGRTDVFPRGIRLAPEVNGFPMIRREFLPEKAQGLKPRFLLNLYGPTKVVS
jgi:hypothetical protein